MRHRLTRSHRLAIIGIAILFVVLNSIPRRGQAHFRYTGVDPTREVLNLGYPLALFIYDGQTRPALKASLSSYLVLPLQALVLLGLAAGPGIWARLKLLSNRLDRRPAMGLALPPAREAEDLKSQISNPRSEI